MKKTRRFLKALLSFICSISIFCSVFIGVSFPSKAATIARGPQISYSTYFPSSSYITHYYYLDGQLAYCIESAKGAVPDGDYGTIYELYDAYPLLCKVLFYGYGDGTGNNGAATQIKGWYSSKYGINLTDDQAYLYTHICANYAYTEASNIWYGITAADASAAHLDEFLAYCSANVIPFIGNYHMTGGSLRIATPGGSLQRIAYLDSYTFEPIGGSVEIKINYNKTKNTSGDATTHNAVFGVFNSSDTELKRVTLTIPAGSTTASGSLNYTFDTAGTYYVKEITAPAGYIIDNTKYYFTVDTSGQKATSTDTHFTLVNDKEITFTKTDEIPIKGNFTFTKKDASGNPLAGAGFDVYLKSTLPISGGSYNYSAATKACGTLTSDASGVVTSPQLDYGTYVVHESTVPAGKLPVADFEVVINTDSVTVNVGDKIDDTVRGKFTFTKKDESGNPLSGAGFDVYLKSAVPISGGSYNFSAATPVCGRLTSGSNGVVTSPDLDYGVYLVHEAVVPTGKLPITDFEVEITSNGTTLNVGDKVDNSIKGQFNFRKVDDYGNYLQGAGFDVYLKSSLTKVGGKWDFSSATPVCPRMTSNASGVVTSPSIPYGTYVVHEAVVPTGKLPVDDFEVTITTNGSNQNLGNKTDNTIRGRFSFRKVDRDSNPLAGAGFDVYIKSSLTKVGGKWDFSSATPIGSRLTSNSSGVVTSGLLDYGVYVIHEAVIPEGKLPVDDFEVSITSDGTTVNVGDKKDQTIQGRFTLLKVGDDGHPVVGAGFSAYKKSSLVVNSDGTYDFTSASPVIISGGGTVLTTDATGKATSDLLDYDTYIVMESVVPVGYEPCDPFEVTIVNHNVTIDVGTKTDTVIPAKFRIIKKDSESGATVLKGGASFKIYDVVNNVYVTIGGEDTFTTDDTGVVTTSDPLPLGTYRIEEVAAPEGYYLNSATIDIVFDSSWPFTMEGTDKIITTEYFNTPKKGRVELTKSGKGLTGFTNDEFVWTDVNLSGAVYEIHADEDIYSPDNQGTLLHAKDDLIGTLTSDASGKAAMDDLYLGKYYLLETTAPTGYVIDTTHKNFSITYNDAYANPIVSENPIFDEKQNIILNLTKTDTETTRPLAGAEFGLYAESDISTFGGTLLFKSGDLIKTTLSDANGIIDFGLDLPYAKYKVKEIQAPVNYVINETEFDFTAVYPASDVINVSFTSTWDNKPVRGSLEITKTGETLSSFTNGEFVWEKKPLKNAKFNVIAKDNIYTFDNAKDANGRRYVYYEKDQIIEEIETDASGFAKTSNLPVGNYYLVETQAPYGMYLDATPIDFSIDYEGQNKPLVLTQKSILNDRQTISLNVSKIANGWGYKLSGGKFDLFANADIKNYNGDVILKKGDLIKSAEAKDGVIEFGLDLPHSLYTVKEDVPPTDYYKNEDAYDIDLSYTDSTLKQIVADFNIFDKRLPHYAKVSFVLKSVNAKKSRNNYITEDNGESGYSVLLISDGTGASVRTSLNVWFYALIASIFFMVGGIVTTAIYVTKKVKAKRR